MTEIDEDESHIAVSETVGSLLKSAREAAGMTLEQAAEKLHLLKATVIALEADDESQLPSRVFTLGYLKNYARIVDVPETRIMELLKDEVEEVKQVRNLQQPRAPRIRIRSRIRTRQQANGGRLFVKTITLLIAVAMIVLLVLWWRGTIQLPDLSGLPFLSTTAEKSAESVVDDGSETLTLSIGGEAASPQKTELDPDAAVAPEDSLKESPEPPVKEGIDENSIELSLDLDRDDSAATPGVEESTQNTSDEADKISIKDTAAGAVVESVAAGAAAGSGDAADIATADAAEEPQASSEGKVTLDFSDKCWVNVNDAEGNIVLFGDIPAGSSKTLEGSAPFTFVLGNAAKVKVSIDGRAYDIAPHIKGGVARFSLGEPGE